jgi:hypothetical protein
MAGISAVGVRHKLGLNMVFDDDSDRTVSDNIDAGPTTLYTMLVDNSGMATKIWVSLWDDTDPVIGTDGPVFSFPVPASGTRHFEFRDSHKFENGLSWATSTGGGTGAAGAPATPPNLYFTTSGGD